MPAHEIYGRSLLSDIELPELPDAPAPEARAEEGPRFPALAFEARLPLPPRDGWFTLWLRPDGDPWVRAARTAAGYHVQYTNCAEFHVDLERRVIAGARVTCEAGMFRHFLVDQVVPLMLSVDQPVLHASSVAIDGGMAAFAGHGGAGKSTIAIALARLGHAIGADDGLLLTDAGEGVPAYPGIRLWPDSEAALAGGLRGYGRSRARAKQRFREGLAFAAAGPLTRLYVLDPGGAAAVTFAPLPPRDAAMELIRQAYRLALDDRSALARQFDTLAALAPALSAWRLSFPRHLTEVMSLACAVHEHLCTPRTPRTSRTPRTPRTRSTPL
jgi:hypothetical protein